MTNRIGNKLKGRRALPVLILLLAVLLLLVRLTALAQAGHSGTGAGDNGNGVNSGGDGAGGFSEDGSGAGGARSNTADSTDPGAALAAPAGNQPPAEIIDTGQHLNRRQMEEALATAKEERWAIHLKDGAEGGRIRCLTLPHHLPAAGLTIHALEELSGRREKPGVIILMGPNHQNIGPAAAVTSAVWQTAYGRVEPQKEIIAALLREGLAAEALECFPQEHSLGMVIPWLAKFLPDTPVVPLLFHYQYPMKDLEKLLGVLEPWLEEDGLLLVSVDFSHHQEADEAARNDEKTAQLLEKGDWRTLAGLSSDYLDSPTLVAAMVRYSLDRKLTGPAVLAHTNTGRLTGIAGQEVTSYFVLAYTEKEAEEQ